VAIYRTNEEGAPALSWTAFPTFELAERWARVNFAGVRYGEEGAKEPPGDWGVDSEDPREVAADHLDLGGCSRISLIMQLVRSKGYSEAEAASAVDSLSVDWNDQAAKSASEYMESGPFSRAELLEQLVYEGYTQEQAEHGVSTTGLGRCGGCGQRVDDEGLFVISRPKQGCSAVACSEECAVKVVREGTTTHRE
jgi:hypothetical protein